ncbi:MAG: hypothetical protein E6J34_18280 [Chloroflexi bacterium]|nr:MAG: hypothetical protein E6J34_18280 [Chloroflexota bacterium]
MNIEGTYTLQASPEEIWHCLTNREVLLHTFPGQIQLEQVNEDLYNMSLNVKYTPLLGTYNGHVKITERQAPYYCHITIEGKGGQNTISGSGGVHLNERNGNTVIAYKGTLVISKHNAPLPATVVKGAAQLFSQQFFASLENQLRASLRVGATHANATLYTTNEGVSVIQQPLGNIVVLPPVSIEEYAETAPLAVKLARFCKLGDGDPEQETLWAKRIRGAGLISGLLLLVWLGTRLPGRFTKQK